MENARKKIFMVDNDVKSLNIGKKILINKYDVFTIPSGEKLFYFIEKITPDLILLAVEMPEMSGYDIIKTLKSREDTTHIPVIFLTESGDLAGESVGMALGAIDYIAKPFSPPLLLKRIEIHMLIESQKKELKKYKEKTEIVFDLQSAVLKTVADLVEGRDDITEGHNERTQNYLWILTEALLKSDQYQEEVYIWDIDAFIMAAGLHDVGKIAVKDKILLKSDGLTTGEFDEIKAHANFGVKIIQKIEDSTGKSIFLEYAKILAGSHHEKWDGTGYPLGLSGKDIPLQGRIMAIVDAYDVLTNDRPYKKAISHEEALEVIKSESGKHFDPGLVEVFLGCEQYFYNAASTSDETSDVIREKKEVDGGLQDTVSKVISEIVDYQNGAASGSVERVQGYMKIMINAMRQHERYRAAVAEWDIDILVLSAGLYDIGKISIKGDILRKPEKLTGDEFEEMKTHTSLGVKVVKSIGEGAGAGVFLEYAENLTGRHHEKWDGTGYPLGLSGEDIPLQSRLMAIVGVYEALVSLRNYKEAFSHSQAVETIKNGSGTQFDPGLVEIFSKCEGEFEDLKKQLR